MPLILRFSSKGGLWPGQPKPSRAVSLTMTTTFVSNTNGGGLYGGGLHMRSQAGRQFAGQRAAALKAESLIDGFVADAHRLVVREVDRQASSGAPGYARRRRPC